MYSWSLENRHGGRTCVGKSGERDDGIKQSTTCFASRQCPSSRYTLRDVSWAQTLPQVTSKPTPGQGWIQYHKYQQCLFFRTLLFSSTIKMTILKNSTSKLSYDEAVAALNSLQTNAITLKKVRKERQKNVHLNLPITKKYFERSGMTIEDLNKMKIIHVSGTKGKGSTCAFCESILRHSGLKTGFYSSPHLVSVTERIRINGKPIDQVDVCMIYFKLMGKKYGLTCF